MAEVAPAGASDRGQLLLVAGLIIAVTVLALALTLNAVIHAETLASRNAGTAGGDDPIRFLDATEDAVAGVLDRANRNHAGSHAALRETVTADLAAWRNASGRYYAAAGAVTNVSPRTLDDGTRLAQTNRSRNFTAADGSSTWTLASGVSGMRQFRVAVTNDSLVAASHATVSAGDGVFHVHVTDRSSSRWRVFVYRNATSGAFAVTVQNETDGGSSTKSEPCSATGGAVSVNITDGTVGGEHCPALSFMSDLRSPYTIGYNETESTAGGPTISGTYHLIVDDASIARSPGPRFNGSPGDSPWAGAAVYAVDYRVVYETARLWYNATVRVAPGEPDG
ncbi:MAG: hypothetical protein ABEH88_10955 [Halobacteriales archaeon]